MKLMYYNYVFEGIFKFSIRIAIHAPLYIIPNKMQSKLIKKN